MRKNVGYVPQNIFLMDDTVRRNIALGIPDEQVDERKLKTAAQIANIHGFILEKLPNGYDTTLGERGIRLSGGQKQRIGLARALYHDPEVLVLDEATSALDGITETAVIDAIEKASASRTVIVIAHRMTTLRNCGMIHVLEEGEIVESGTYQTLMQRSARFRAMARESGGPEPGKIVDKGGNQGANRD